MTLLAAWGLCLLGGQGVAWAGAALLRPHGSDGSSVWHFALGFFGTECAPQLLAGSVVVASAAIAGGALLHPSGWFGLSLVGVADAGLLWSLLRTRGTTLTLRRALAEGVGVGFEAAIPPARASALRQAFRVRDWWWPLRFRRAGVVRETDIAYGPVRHFHTLDVYRPLTAGGEPRPVLVNIHGGAWFLGEKGYQALPLLWDLASRGWVCVDVNYRLSPRARMPEHLVDVKRAIAWVRANVARHGGDPDFIAVTGGSAGGHLAALAALTINDPRYQPGFEEADTTVSAAVPFYGKFDFVDRLGVPGAAGVTRFLERKVMPVPWRQDPVLWDRMSPTAVVRADAPPFFVLHGTHDTLVPVIEARAFVAALRAASASNVAYAELRGAHHAWDLVRSIRTERTSDAVHRFLEYTYARRGSLYSPAA